MNGCAASTKWIEHDISGIARSADDPLKQCNGFLRGITKPLLSLGVDLRDIIPNRLNGFTFDLVEKTLTTNSFGFIFWEIKSAFFRSEERRVGKECRSRWSPY